MSIHTESRLNALERFYNLRLAAATPGEAIRIRAKMAALKTASKLPASQASLIDFIGRKHGENARLIEVIFPAMVSPVPERGAGRGD